MKLPTKTSNSLYKKHESFFKVTITKKIILVYLFLLIFTVGVAGILSYYFLQLFIDNKIKNIDTASTRIKLKIEEIYENNDEGLLKIPNLKKTDSSLIIEPLVKDYPDYSFKIETLEGTFEYEEEPKLIYDKAVDSYFFEISRKINFSGPSPFKSLSLSTKFDYYKLILKSLFFGALISICIMLPIILLFSRTLINPITNLSKKSKQIASGNLGVLVEVNSNDELGELAQSFNYMSKELYKMKKIRDDLLAVISHELRSPLGRIKGYTELLHDLKLNKNEQKIYYDSIFNEIDFLNYMVGEIIEISRLELNKEQLFLEKINLADLIQNIQNEFELSSRNNGVSYHFQFDDDLYCNIDVDKMKRVLKNVIENSMKAGATTINVRSFKDDENINIVVDDNGVGIPEDQLEIVFEKFYRVDKSRDRNTGGFGLGLAICRGIVKEHGGNIYFKYKDKGAELHIELKNESESDD